MIGPDDIDHKKYFLKTFPEGKFNDSLTQYGYTNVEVRQVGDHPYRYKVAMRGPQATEEIIVELQLEAAVARLQFCVRICAVNVMNQQISATLIVAPLT